MVAGYVSAVMDGAFRQSMESYKASLDAAAGVAQPNMAQQIAQHQQVRCSEILEGLRQLGSAKILCLVTVVGALRENERTDH